MIGATTMTSYDEIYLEDAQLNLADAVDYAVNGIGMDACTFEGYFLASGYARAFGIGDPTVVAGMSGVEMVRKIIRKVERRDVDTPFPFDPVRSPEYWAGWALAYYQWECTRTFQDIFNAVPLEEIVGMYPRHHEMDITAFVRDMDALYAERLPETKLARLRKHLGISQQELADRAGVNIRSIQMYEQRVNDINKAQAATVCRLAHALYGRAEDILETPLRS
jgi:DNA-binding XRE family transcriptional regulator